MEERLGRTRRRLRRPVATTKPATSKASKKKKKGKENANLAIFSLVGSFSEFDYG